jgi:hypothetical protein
MPLASVMNRLHELGRPDAGGFSASSPTYLLLDGVVFG